MTDAEAKDPVTRADAVMLTAAVDRLTAKFKWQQRLTAGLIVAFVGVCAALGLGALALVQIRHENACVAALAAASADRSGTLAPLSQDRAAAAASLLAANAQVTLDALNTYGLSLAQRKAILEPDISVFTAANITNKAANDAYNQAYAANPPPKPKAFHC